MKTTLIDLGFGVIRVREGTHGVYIMISTPSDISEGVYEPPQCVQTLISSEKVQELVNALADASR